MKRKINLVGQNTLTVSLPTTWIKANNISKGDEVDVIEQYDNLLVTLNEFKKQKMEIEIDISNLDRTSIILYVQSLYKYGYDKITLFSKNNSINHFRRNKSISVSEIIFDAVSRLIGTEITSQTENKFIIQTITKESEETFDTIIRRTFRLLNEMLDSFSQGIKSNNISTFENIEFQYKNFKRFINYDLRILNIRGYKDKQKTAFMFSLINIISKIGDFVKDNSRIIVKNKIKFSNNSVNLIFKITNNFENFYKLYYLYTKQNGHELLQQREVIKAEMINTTSKISNMELLIISRMSQITELCLDLYELKISLEEN